MHHYDEGTGIYTRYDLQIEGVRVDFDDGWRPGVAVSLYEWGSPTLDKGFLLHTEEDCPKVFQWMLHRPRHLDTRCRIVIKYLKDEHNLEELATGEGADEIASRAKYDRRDEARIAVTRTLSIGTSTVWFKIERLQRYKSTPGINVDVRICLEFAQEEDCTRFIHEDMRKLEDKDIIDVGDIDIYDGDTVVDAILRALVPFAANALSMRKNALRYRLSLSQFLDEFPQPETKPLIRHRPSNRGHDRPCYLTLHLSTTLRLSFSSIVRVDWSATNVPPTFPSHSGAFRSLNNLHLKFPAPASQDRNYDSSSQRHQDDLTITISPREISFSSSTSTNSASLGNGFTLSSEHRIVNVNYINAIMGDAFMGPISGGNNGGRNNVNTICMSSPDGSRSPRVAWSLPRMPTPLLPEQAEPQGGVGRWVQQRSPRPRPY